MHENIYFHDKIRLILKSDKQTHQSEYISDCVTELFMENNSSSLILVTHVPKATIKRFEEKPRVTAITFISDVGGIIGVFLGISFWSIYQIIIFPLLVELQCKYLQWRYSVSTMKSLSSKKKVQWLTVNKHPQYFTAVCTVNSTAVAGPTLFLSL